MIEWILILTLNYSGAAIYSIPGFMSEAECNTAGKIWKDKQYMGAIYTCVPRSK